MERHFIYNATVLWILVGLIIVLWTFGGVLLAVNAAGIKNVPEGDIAAVVAGNSQFAFDLYAKLKDDPKIQQQGGNLFFSPYSISTALAMTYAGARSETEKQMAKVLHFDLGQDSLHAAFGQLENKLNAGGERRGYQLSVANALWGQEGYGFLKGFLELTERSYGAGLRQVDFAGETEKARRTINKWVQKQTKDKIKDLIGPRVLDALTRLVLTNAIYFKGDWASKFKEENTRPAPFYVTKKQTQQVPMMYQKGRFKYVEKEDVLILELPYKGEDLSMIVLLPQEVDGLAELEKSLTPQQLEEWLGNLGKREVAVYLPKFKMTTGPLELKDILKHMGMRDAFSLPPADFSAMTGKKDLFISHILHKAFVEVNEEGTEAAAATAVVMTKGAAMGPVFRADHPFVFMIKDNRLGSILFMGRVMNPGKASVSKRASHTLPQDKNGNFFLTVSNQSFAINPVDIKVYIDDKVAIDQDFDVGKLFPQHNWQVFQYSLPKGRHLLRAESVTGRAKLQKEFEVKDKHWAVLDYWFYPDTHYEPTPKHFTFGVSDKPVYAGD